LYAEDEIKRIQANKKKDLKKINSLKMFLEPYVKEKSLKQLGTFKVSLRKSSKVNIVDESLIPEDFKQYDEVLKIDKLKIKEALKSQDVDGCELITNETLQIK
jgi:sulfur relay (sulfurtransferase) DsrF/TusC family protein